MDNQVDKIAAALSKAQGEMKAAVLSKTAMIKSDRGSYQYSYADLNDVWSAIREPFAKNGLSVSQIEGAEYKNEEYIDKYDNKTKIRGVAIVSVTTLLMHESGQTLQSTLSLKAADDTPQKVGSAITYCRRYGLSGMAGVSCDSDDDGNQAQGQDAQIGPKTSGKAPVATARPPLATAPVNRDDEVTAPNAAAEAEFDKMCPPQNGKAVAGSTPPPMTDVDRGRAGLIGMEAFEALKKLLVEKKIGQKAWKTWLRAAHGFGGIAEITVAKYAEIVGEVNNKTEVIAKFVTEEAK